MFLAIVLICFSNFSNTCGAISKEFGRKDECLKFITEIEKTDFGIAKSQCVTITLSKDPA